jgi:hypothetical protein
MPSIGGRASGEWDTEAGGDIIRELSAATDSRIREFSVMHSY